MGSNLSLIVNVLLLIGVIITITRMMLMRRKRFGGAVPYRPTLSQSEAGSAVADDIIAVRKINASAEGDLPVLNPAEFSKPASPTAAVRKPMIPTIHTFEEPVTGEQAQAEETETASSLMIFLLAKGNRRLGGYELLQTILASGLRFGEGQLFHRHQSANGQGPVLCSLAAATPTGIFDMQNIGAFSTHGLCLFMHASGNVTIDKERFSIMLDTAKQLSEGLDTYLLDDRREVFSEESVRRYHRLLKAQE